MIVKCRNSKKNTRFILNENTMLIDMSTLLARSLPLFLFPAKSNAITVIDCSRKLIETKIHACAFKYLS